MENSSPKKINHVNYKEFPDDVRIPWLKEQRHRYYATHAAKKLRKAQCDFDDQKKLEDCKKLVSGKYNVLKNEDYLDQFEKVMKAFLKKVEKPLWYQAVCSL